MLAKRTGKIIGKLICFHLIAADLAAPYRFGSICYALKVLFRVLAKRTGKIIGQLVCFNLVAANFAAPHGLSHGLFCLGLRLNVRVVVSVGGRGYIRKGHSIGHVGNKQCVRAKINRVKHLCREHGVCALCDIRNTVLGARKIAVIGKFVGVSAALKSKALKHIKARLLRKDRNDGRTNRSRAYDKPKADGKKAVLNYRVAGCSTRYTLVEVELLTGRHHQIRAQLSKIGCPIKGDLKYGAKRSNPDGGISLHSRRVEFLHPVRKEMITITAPVPKDNLWEFFETM